MHEQPIDGTVAMWSFPYSHIVLHSGQCRLLMYQSLLCCQHTYRLRGGWVGVRAYEQDSIVVMGANNWQKIRWYTRLFKQLFLQLVNILRWSIDHILKKILWISIEGKYFYLSIYKLSTMFYDLIKHKLPITSTFRILNIFWYKPHSCLSSPPVRF